MISAAGAATPDVRAEPYNGATCQWQVDPGIGENYVVDYDSGYSPVRVCRSELHVSKPLKSF